MSLLYLVRHPHTQVDLSKPVHTWGLSADGHAQTAVLRAAGFWQGVAAIYPSTERKAILPAQAAADRYNMPVIPHPAFNEVDRQAYTAPDVAAYQANVKAFLTNPAASARGWETGTAALARFRAGITELQRRHSPDESVAVITHGLVLTVFMADLRGESPSLEWWRVLDFCTVAALNLATLQPLTGFLLPPYKNLPRPADR